MWGAMNIQGGCVCVCAVLTLAMPPFPSHALLAVAWLSLCVYHCAYKELSPCHSEPGEKKANTFRIAQKEVCTHKFVHTLVLFTRPLKATTMEHLPICILFICTEYLNWANSTDDNSICFGSARHSLQLANDVLRGWQTPGHGFYPIKVNDRIQKQWQTSQILYSH